MAHRANDLQSLRLRSLIPIDIHVYTPEEVEIYGNQQFSFVRSVLKSGKIVFEQ